MLRKLSITIQVQEETKEATKNAYKEICEEKEKYIEIPSSPSTNTHPSMCQQFSHPPPPSPEKPSSSTTNSVTYPIKEFLEKQKQLQPVATP